MYKPIRWRELVARRLSRRRALALTGAGTLALAAACGGRSTGSSSGAGERRGTADAVGEAAKPKRGGTLTLALQSQMGTLHPQSSGGSTEVARYVYDRLLHWDYVHDSYELSAASTLEQPEPTRIVFQIKPAAKWQPVAPANGRSVTSEDVLKAWLAFRDNPKATATKALFDDVNRFETPDSSTFILIMKRMNVWTIGPHGIAAPFATTITPKELADSTDDLEKIACGSGGYVLDKFDPSQGISFNRRPDGWHSGDRPYIDRVVYRVITDETARAAALRSKQIDALTARDRLQAEEFTTYGKDIVIDRDLAPPRRLFLRSDRPPFHDPRTWQAVYATLDIKELINRVELGEGQPSGPVPPYLGEYTLPADEIMRNFPVDLMKAKQLLTAAGWDPNLTVEFKFPATPKSQLLAEVLQKQLNAIGIRTGLMPQDPRTVWPTVLRNADFQMACAEQVQASQDPDQWLRGGWGSRGLAGTGNQARWTDKEIDELIARGQGEADKKARKEIVWQIQRLIFQKFAPAINLFVPYELTARWATYHPVTDRGTAGLWGHHSWIG
jgi:peptide/nickel transport system substrate-binding protein